MDHGELALQALDLGMGIVVGVGGRVGEEGGFERSVQVCSEQERG